MCRYSGFTFSSLFREGGALCPLLVDVCNCVSFPDEDEEEQALEDLIAMPEGKIGAKKRKKLEMKAEKRLQREVSYLAV